MYQSRRTAVEGWRACTRLVSSPWHGMLFPSALLPLGHCQAKKPQDDKAGGREGSACSGPVLPQKAEPTSPGMPVTAAVKDSLKARRLTKEAALREADRLEARR
jgi:hypothetical protein